MNSICSIFDGMHDMSEGFTHLDRSGSARMVDVSAKDVTVREATASGQVTVSPEVIELLRGPGVPKGDALAVARIAGIQAAKRTPELVPLCHPLAIHGVTVELEVMDRAVAISATVRTADRTGVEMEALTCVAVAALALIDMVKAVDPGAHAERAVAAPVGSHHSPGGPRCPAHLWRHGASPACGSP